MWLKMIALVKYKEIITIYELSQKGISYTCEVLIIVKLFLDSANT